MPSSRILYAPFDLYSCFSQDYAESRARFTKNSQQFGAQVKTYINPNQGPAGEQLATDVAWIGSRQASKILVLQSGTHGVEGFTGAASMLDWLQNGSHLLKADTAVLLIHALNPYGFAWLRRVTEENVDLNRNFIDFSKPLPANLGHDELADAFVPQVLTSPEFEAAEAKILAYRTKYGERAFQIARSGGQYRHPHSVFYGGSSPTWARRTLEAIIDDHELVKFNQVVVVDYHTGLGPFGYGEPICCHETGSLSLRRARLWYGDSVTEPAAGTSSSVMKQGLNEYGWIEKLADRVTYIALEYGTYSIEQGRRVLREDHWLHAFSKLDWNHPEAKRIKQQIRKHYYPDTDDWREMVLFRSRQIINQALQGLAAS